MRVSAIVSVYNAREHIVPRIENLLAQTLYRKGELEIVVVNAGNVRSEHDLILPYLARNNFKYIRSLREPIYLSWNRGIALSRGEFITNANCDDRLYPDSLELLSSMLMSHPEFGVVYPDMIAVKNFVGDVLAEAQPVDDGPYAGDFSWPPFDAKLLTQYCFTGPMPMWRRRLHSEYGLFDPSYQLAGDYEFFLRLAAYGVQFKHTPFKAGLFYAGGTGITNLQLSGAEARRAILAWRDKIYERSNDHN